MTHFEPCFLSAVKLRRMIFLGGIFIFLFFAQKFSYSQDRTNSFSFDGHMRDYMVFFPNNYSNKSTFPLVIYLHSYDWNAEIEMEYTLMNLVADTSGFILVTPNAVDKRWNNGDDPDWPSPDVDDVGFINALIDTLLNRDNYIDPERIYACGFSSGGFMTYRLACQLSHRFAAVASVGGLINHSVADNCYPDHSMPVLHIHGTSDGVVSFLGGSYNLSTAQVIDYFADLNDCVQVDTILLPDIDPTDKCTVEKIIYSNSSDESNVILYKVIGGGHSWPGAATDYWWTGNRNLDMNAGVEILNFFKNYGPVTSVGYRDGNISTDFYLMQNYPNPFNQTTTIEFNLNKTSQVRLKIFNILSEEVATLVSDRLSAGSYNYEWNANGVEAGIYFYRIEAGDYTETMKCLILR